MKHSNIIIALFALFTLTNCTFRTHDKDIDNTLNHLLEQKDYFKLRELLENNEDHLTESKFLFYSAFVSKAFGDSFTSNDYITTLLEKHKKDFNDTIIVQLLDLKATNCLYNYDYKQASEIYAKIMTDYSIVLDSLEVINYTNVKNLFGAFAHVKPQIMHRQDDVRIASYRNHFNHLMTPVKSGGISEDFIFDTGANISTISEGQAKKMNLTMIEQKIDVGSSTLINVQSKLAVADSLFVGDILFENVLFLVMPDDQLSFPEIDYQIHGIIGFPLIHQMDEVHLHKDGSITVPKTTQKRGDKNMFLEGLNPVVRVFSETDTLLFTFDTGAIHSELSFKYFNERKDIIEKHGKSETNLRGGAGGVAEVNEYILENFPINIGSKSTTLPKISVTLEEYAFNKYFDGNLGQDVFMQFESLIINFKHMYIDFR